MHSPRFTSSVVSSVVIALLAACGGNDAADQPPATAEEAIRQAQAMAGGGAAASVDPIPAADLQARLPTTLAGLKRQFTERQDMGAMGIRMSTASGRYESGSRRVDVTVTDAGGAAAMAPMAAAWAMMDFDRTTADGYERTIRFEGYKGYESVGRQGSASARTKLALLLGERIVIQFEGRDVSMDDLKAAARELPLARWARGT